MGRLGDLHGSASYLQTKHEVGKSPTVAAVFLMSLPYFLVDNIIFAFAASLLVSILLALTFTYQGSVYTDAEFLREFAQTVGLLLGIAALAYAMGDLLSTALGVRGLIK